MKDVRFERLRRRQRDYHRRHPWPLSAGGLFVPHRYDEVKPDSLSWWDDVGFILNRRRVMVWWRHPRCVYRDRIEEMAYMEVGEPPDDEWPLGNSAAKYRRVGRSRKKVASYVCGEPSQALREYHDRLRRVENRLMEEGIDFVVRPSLRVRRLDWCDGVDLVAPMEVRNEADLAEVARLVRRLMRRETALVEEFPGYCYGRADWLDEKGKRGW